MREIELFIDLDNTIVNFDKHVIDIMNSELGMNYNWKDNTSWWWEDTGVNKTYFENLLLRQNTFLNCEPIKDATEYINILHSEGYNITFITLPEWNNVYCVNEKIQWLQRYFDWFDVNKHIVFTKMKHLVSKPNRVLIDDTTSYLDKWDSIKICKATNCNKDYQGLRCNNWKEIYCLIKLMEEGKYDNKL
jgi:hypothetical protein|nr:MAG TPA: 5' nucleotidase [Caudoviricetes sp.]